MIHLNRLWVKPEMTPGHTRGNFVSQVVSQWQFWDAEPPWWCVRAAPSNGQMNGLKSIICPPQWGKSRNISPKRELGILILSLGWKFALLHTDIGRITSSWVSFKSNPSHKCLFHCTVCCCCFLGSSPPLQDNDKDISPDPSWQTPLDTWLQFLHRSFLHRPPEGRKNCLPQSSFHQRTAGRGGKAEAEVKIPFWHGNFRCCKWPSPAPSVGARLVWRGWALVLSQNQKKDYTPGVCQGWKMSPCFPRSHPAISWGNQSGSSNLCPGRRVWQMSWMFSVLFLLHTTWNVPGKTWQLSTLSAL